MAKHSLEELYQYQSLSLRSKIAMTRDRIKGWYKAYDGMVCASFSGGKDSTVLVDLITNECGYDDVPLVYVDTGLEYPEIREFVKGYGDRVVWLKPRLNFKQVIEKYGYPLISKEVSEAVYSSRIYLEKIRGGQEPKYKSYYRKLTGSGEYSRGGMQSTENYAELASMLIKDNLYNVPCRTAMLMGEYTIDWGKNKKENIPSTDKSMFSMEKWQFMLGAPFSISHMCCSVMKKAPIHKYNRETGRMPMTGQMASESRLRTQQWIRNGCNGFDMKSPISNPMAFWTEQDVLMYIKEKNLPICSVYGDVVEDYTSTGQIEGQMDLSDIYDMGIFEKERPLLKTTGCDRTGCMYCGFGCHLEKESRFVRMKQTHPNQYEWIMKPKSEGGLGYKEIIDWLNENGNLHIQY